MARRMRVAAVCVAAAAGLLAGGCKEKAVVAAAPPPDPEATLLVGFRSPKAGEIQKQDSEELVQLGRLLYFDPRLSKNHDVSCNSCHDLANYGVDGKQRSSGHKGQLGARNSPTVYDAAHHVAQFWDGRAKDLEEQASGPMLNPVEMAMPDEARVVATLSSMPEYRERFARLFPGEQNPVTLANAARAIAAFERTLVTTSPFDRFLQGDKTALNDQEQRGLASFVKNGCTACHWGPNAGGTMFQKLGLRKPWLTDAGEPDRGRFALTHNDADRDVFRVPPLRNVQKTAPYFHDGSQKDLATAVKQMVSYQLGHELPDGEAADIVAFLGALTGKLPPPELIAAPLLPESTPETPKPDPT